MASKAIKCTIVRGGTSKGIFVERSELPAPGPDRDRVILALFGTPDKRQIDGLGGADKLTSKLAVMGPPTRPDCDVDYLFGQVGTALPTIDWKSNCGNISAGAAAYAVYRGYVATTEPAAHVRIHQANTGRRLLATVPVVDGELATEGDFKIGGVPGTGARIDLDFQDFSGCILNRGLLPTGSPIDRITIPRLGKLDVSIVDVANLCAFVRASDVGMDNAEDIESLQANDAIVAMLESIRSAVAVASGFVTGGDIDHEMKVRMNPLLFVVGTPRDYKTLNGEAIPAEATDLFSRSIARWAFSKAYPATGSIGTGVACTVPGTIPAQMVRGGAPVPGEARKIRVGHPSGTLVVDAGIAQVGGELKVIRGSVGRTARVLMEGTAFIRA